jgi:hypothetical protein
MVMAPLIGGLAGAIDYRLAFLAAAFASFVLMIIVRRRSRSPIRRSSPAFVAR